VLELGSGTGVAGLAAALLGARVTVTDTAAISAPGGTLAGNAARNAAAILEAGGSARVRALDWGGAPSGGCARLVHELDCGDEGGQGAGGGGEGDGGSGYGLLLGSDLVFHSKTVRPLGRAVRALLGDPVGAVDVVILRKILLLAHTSRSAELDAELRSVWAGEFGLHLRQIPLSAHHPLHRAPRVQLLIVSMRS